MGLLTGQTITQGDFITTSAGATDSGKVPKLNSDGKVDGSFFYGGLGGLADLLLAGESLPAFVPVFIGPSGSIADTFASLHNSNTDGSGLFGQMGLSGGQYDRAGGQLTGYGDVGAVKVRMGHNGPASGGNMVIDIYSDSSGLPGTLLGTSNVINTNTIGQYFSGTLPVYTFTFSTPVSVNGLFWYVARISSYSGGGVFMVGGQVSGGTRFATSMGGSFSLFTSNATQDVDIQVTLTPGSIYRSNSGDTNRARFDGMAVVATARGSNAQVILEGTLTGLSGLTPGADYFVQTNGSLGTTSTAVKAGRAISATKLLIRKY